MIPTNLESLEESELLSPEGKARFAAEPEVRGEMRSAMDAGERLQVSGSTSAKTGN